MPIQTVARRTRGSREGESSARDGSLFKLARDHNIARAHRIVRVLCYLDLLRSRGVLARGTRVSRVEARWDSLPAGGGRAAAHALPCGLRVPVNGQALDITQVGPEAGTRGSLELLLGYVQNLPAVFDETDELVEDHESLFGLAAAFEAAANRVLGAQDGRRGASGGVNTVRVEDAFATYRSWAAIAFDIARGRISEMEQPLDPARTDSPERRREQLLILDGYQSTNVPLVVTPLVARQAETHFANRFRARPRPAAPQRPVELHA